MSDTVRSQLFTYALIWNPTKDQSKEGKKSKLIKDPTHLLAKDQATASLIIARQIPDEYINDLDQIEIVLNPF